MPAAAIDPDDFFDFARDEPVTREEGRAAWDAAYAALEARLASLGPRAQLYVVFGLQAGGKSSWVCDQLAMAGDETVFFSGPLPSRAHRARGRRAGGRGDQDRCGIASARAAVARRRVAQGAIPAESGVGGLILLPISPSPLVGEGDEGRRPEAGEG